MIRRNAANTKRQFKDRARKTAKLNIPSVRRGGTRL